ncbi:ficolin-2-like [Saccostrea cucullata]|uniref:ficolin-2-like n=1 Tax=Saccostrea cuccullata TaxID=36930 RepID=UPI002ED0BC8B
MNTTRLTKILNGARQQEVATAFGTHQWPLQPLNYRQKTKNRLSAGNHTKAATSTDCKDLLEYGSGNTGVYEIYLYKDSSRPVRVECDMDINGGGWTVIQKRVNGSLSFDRNWIEYKYAFGSPEQDVWVGDSMLDTGYPDNFDLSGMYFSTADRDDDRNGFNCARDEGGWWFNNCYIAFLNGPWSGWPWPWNPTVKFSGDLKDSRMLIKRR